MSRFTFVVAACAATVSLGSFTSAAVLTAGDPTTGLVPPTGPSGTSLLIDDAINGGGDSVFNAAAVQTVTRTFDLDGAAGAPGVTGIVRITGIGFATNNLTASQNASTTLKFDFRYLGANGTFESSGGDDVSLPAGTAFNYSSVVNADTSQKLYFVNFDTPLARTIDGLGEAFRITVTGSSASYTFKTTTGTSFSNVKLSVAGYFTPNAVPEPGSAAATAAALGATLRRRRRA